MNYKKALDDWLEAENNYNRMQISRFLSMAEEDGAITILGLQQLATLLGVENAESIHQKIELIQSIQNVAHHRPCFRVKPGIMCDEGDCIWRAECKKLIAEWCR